MDKKIFTIDGNNFSDYKGFVDEFGISVFGDQLTWGGGFASFGSLLNNYEVEGKNFTIHWLNSHKSLEDLGYGATLAWLESGKDDVHESNKILWDKRIELAKAKMGDTIFQIIIGIIVKHKNITLILD